MKLFKQKPEKKKKECPYNQRTQQEFILSPILNAPGQKIFVIAVKGFKPGTSCVGDKDATTVSAM